MAAFRGPGSNQHADKPARTVATALPPAAARWAAATAAGTTPASPNKHGSWAQRWPERRARRALRKAGVDVAALGPARTSLAGRTITCMWEYRNNLQVGQRWQADFDGVPTSPQFIIRDPDGQGTIVCADRTTFAAHLSRLQDCG